MASISSGTYLRILENSQSTILGAGGFYFLSINLQDDSVLSSQQMQINQDTVTRIRQNEAKSNGNTQNFNSPNFFMIEINKTSPDKFKFYDGSTSETNIDSTFQYIFYDGDEENSCSTLQKSWTNSLEFLSLSTQEENSSCLQLQIDPSKINTNQNGTITSATIHLTNDQGTTTDHIIYFKIFYYFNNSPIMTTATSDDSDCEITMMMQTQSQANGFYFEVYGQQMKFVSNNFTYDFPLSDVNDDSVVIQTIGMQDFAKSHQVVKTSDGSGSDAYFLRITLDASSINTQLFVLNLREINTEVILRQGNAPSTFSSYQDCPTYKKVKFCQKTNRQPYFCGESCQQSTKYVLKVLASDPNKFSITPISVSSDESSPPPTVRKFMEETSSELSVFEMSSLTESFDILIKDEEADKVTASWTGFGSIKYIQSLELVSDWSQSPTLKYALRLNFNLSSFNESQAEQSATVHLKDHLSTGDPVVENLTFELQFITHFCANIEYYKQAQCYKCDEYLTPQDILQCQYNFIAYDTTHRCYGQDDIVSKQCFKCESQKSKVECQDRVLACIELEESSEIQSCVKCEQMSDLEKTQCYAQYLKVFVLTFPDEDNKTLKENEALLETDENRKEEIQEEAKDFAGIDGIQHESKDNQKKGQKSQYNIDRMFDQFQQMSKDLKEQITDEQLQDIKVVPVDFRATISRQGEFNLEFNQDMIVPFDFSKRRLQDKIQASYDDFDVQRDLIEIDLGEDQSNVEDVRLTNWDKRNFEVQISFIDPLSVAVGSEVSFEIKDPNMFITEAAGTPLPTSKVKVSKSIPKQLPKGVSQEEFESAAGNIQKTMFIVVVIQLAAQKLIGGVMKYLLSLILILQMVVVINEYGSISLPGQTEIIFKAIAGVVNMQVISPDVILEALYPKVLPKVYTVDELITGKKQQFSAILDANGKSSVNVLVNMQLYFFVAAIVLIFLLVLGLAKLVCRNQREVIEKKIRETLKALFWNKFIQSFVLQFQVNLLAHKLVMDMWQFGNGEEVSFLNIALAVIQGQALLWAPIFMISFIKKNRKKIEDADPEFLEKYSILTEDIHLTRSKTGKYFFAISLLRKFFFMMIPIFVPRPLQIPLLIFLQSLFMEWFGSTRPHIERKVQILELVNEVFFMIIIYHMVYLTPIIDTWGLSSMIQFTIGNSLIRVIYIWMAINAAFAIYMVFIQSISKRRKSANQKKYMELYKQLMSHERFYCMKSHAMQFLEMDPDDFTYQNARCYDCSEYILEKEPMVICGKCEIYVCLKCSHKYIKKYKKRYRCNRGHKMTIEKELPIDCESHGLNCNVCKKDISKELFKKHLNCKKCQVSICSSCSYQFDQDRQKTNKFIQKKHLCVKGHEMKFRDSIPEEYPEGIAYCDDCTKTILDGDQYITCLECERDICRACSFFYVKQTNLNQSSSVESSVEEDNWLTLEENKNDETMREDFDEFTKVKVKKSIMPSRIQGDLKYLRKEDKASKNDALQNDLNTKSQKQITRQKIKRLAHFKRQTKFKTDNKLTVVEETDDEQNESARDASVESFQVIKVKAK